MCMMDDGHIDWLIGMMANTVVYMRQSITIATGYWHIFIGTPGMIPLNLL